MSDVYSFKSYSQEGEDMILRQMLSGKRKGFYVDVGAHHPRRFSNTYFFYQLGWSGINIDAMPGSMAPFKTWRPRDINIEAAIGNDNCEMTFFVFNEPALNSFDEVLSRSRDGVGYHITQELTMTTRTLAEILTRYLPKEQKIDFLSIDVEGMDLEALRSNDWVLFRPMFTLVECLGLEFEEIKDNAVYQFMKENGYKAFAKTYQTVIFRDGFHD